MADAASLDCGRAFMPSRTTTSGVAFRYSSTTLDNKTSTSETDR